ncbi:Rho termination factor [Trebonia kvetii]|uniref:Rho termination factor n=1 Tax=Trebonia kvetii TaxID=2480626 RepID=A0A6P2BNR8_9ACTN|nr:Rho termination factor [Trebonia kvetii]TVZ00709.1 Rho termination factor [Trebonia kvetii]
MTLALCRATETSLSPRIGKLILGRDKRRDPGSQLRTPAFGGLAEGSRGGTSPGYEDWTKKQLAERAREIGVKGRSSMSKQRLISALRNH